MTVILLWILQRFTRWLALHLGQFVLKFEQLAGWIER